MAASPAREAASLAQYAAVKAAVTEGFPLADVLAVEGLTPRAFARADLAWKQRLVAEPELLAAYELELAQAEDWLERSVEPLAEDAAAWTSFLAAFEAHPAPFELLHGNDLGMNDVSRLRRRWTRRAEEDAKLGELLVELRAKPGKLGPLRVGSRVLRPSRVAALSAPSAPSSGGAAAPKALQGTGPLLDVPRAAVVPFMPAQGAISIERAEPKPPRAAESLTGTAPLPDIPRGAALPFPRSTVPAAVKPPPPVVAETGPLVDVPRGPALPFAPGASEAPRPPTPTAQPQRPRAHREAAVTSPVQALPRGPAIPFAEAAPARPAGAPASSKRAPQAPAQLGETSLSLEIPRELLRQTASAQAAVTGATSQSSTPPPSPSPSSKAGTSGPAPLAEPIDIILPLAQYAALCAELSLFPDAAEEIFRRYGLSSAERRSAVDATWKERLRERPTEYARWQEMFRQRHAHFAKRGRPAG
ncbi:hypothetical protein [Sorangium sp. So ce204]|uniref:hypothetical protein n=1 Tax=Sorangium sp. So ce204 TaxID=3133288 RepID=UPI003F5DA240